jgi:hypothetical protein
MIFGKKRRFQRRGLGWSWSDLYTVPASAAYTVATLPVTAVEAGVDYWTPGHPWTPGATAPTTTTAPPTVQQGKLPPPTVVATAPPPDAGGTGSGTNWPLVIGGIAALVTTIGLVVAVAGGGGKVSLGGRRSLRVAR